MAVTIDILLYYVHLNYTNPNQFYKVLYFIDNKHYWFVIPKMNKVINYLISRDMDSDDLLEQDHNEDWMDSVVRTKK